MLSMAQGEFVVATDDVWDASLGVIPQTEEASGDDFVREIRFPISATEELHLTWDTTDASVRVRYLCDRALVVDVYREDATLLTTEHVDDERFVVVEHGTSEANGRCRVRVAPAFAYEDTNLRA
jgi:hypothetical protein